MYLLDGELKTDPADVSRVLGPRTESGHAYHSPVDCGNAGQNPYGEIK